MSATSNVCHGVSFALYNDRLALFCESQPAGRRRRPLVDANWKRIVRWLVTNVHKKRKRQDCHLCKAISSSATRAATYNMLNGSSPVEAPHNADGIRGLWAVSDAPRFTERVVWRVAQQPVAAGSRCSMSTGTPVIRFCCTYTRTTDKVLKCQDIKRTKPAPVRHPWRQVVRRHSQGSSVRDRCLASYPTPAHLLKFGSITCSDTRL